MKLNGFVFIILWMGVMGLFFHFVQVEEPVEIMGKTKMRTSLWAAILVVLPIVFMVAKRGNIGDTNSYRKLFNNMPNTWSSMADFVSQMKKDVAFYWLMGFIKVFISDDVTVFFGILAIIQLLMLVFVYRRYAPAYVMAFFLFIVSTDYLSWMYNGIRQFTAVTIVFLGTPWLLNKKYLPYGLLVIFASLFHQSALLMLPIMIIVSGEAWNWRTIVVIILALLIVMYVDMFTNILDSLLEETQYENVVSDWKSWKDDGTNPFRVAVYSVPAILSYIGRRHIRYERNSVINLCTNMSIITVGLYLVSMVTSGIFIGRLPIYTSLYNYILLPWEIEHIFIERSSKFMNMALVCLYLLFYVYQMHIVFSFF